MKGYNDENNEENQNNKPNKSNLVSVTNSKNYDGESPGINQIQMESKSFVMSTENNNELKEASVIVEKLKKYSADKEVSHNKSLRANESGLRNK